MDFMRAPHFPLTREPELDAASGVVTGGEGGGGSEGGRQWRVFLLDDHPLFRFGLRRLLERQPHLTVCGEARNAVEGLAEVLRLKPDLIIVDVSLNESANGIEFVKNIRAHLGDARIMMLSMHDESVYALRAVRAGAQGYLMKEEVLERVVEAVRTVMDGGVYLSAGIRRGVIEEMANGGSPGHSAIDTLSDRELEVLQLSGEGLAPREIAARLGISVKTVESHRMRVREKLNLANSAELMRFAVGWSERTNGTGVRAMGVFDPQINAD